MNDAQQVAKATTTHLAVNPPLSYSSSLHSSTSFQDEFGEVCFPGQRLSKRDVEVLIRWLSRDIEALVSDGEVCLPSPYFFYAVGAGTRLGDQVTRVWSDGFRPSYHRSG